MRQLKQKTETDTAAGLDKLRKAIIAVTTVCLLLVLAFLFFPQFFKLRLDYDVFKLTYQFLLLTVIGGGVSFLFTFYVKRREELARDKERNEAKWKEEKLLQRHFYTEFLQAYNDGKKIRRFLRARTRKLVCEAPHADAIFLRTGRYDELMKELTLLQLKCEFFYDEVSGNKKLFAGGDVAALQANLKLIEEYLNDMVGEYEGCYRFFPNKSFIDDVSYINLDELKYLKEFIGPYKEAKLFQTKFKKASGEVVKILLTILTAAPNN